MQERRAAEAAADQLRKQHDAEKQALQSELQGDMDVRLRKATAELAEERARSAQEKEALIGQHEDALAALRAESAAQHEELDAKWRVELEERTEEFEQRVAALEDELAARDETIAQLRAQLQKQTEDSELARAQLEQDLTENFESRITELERDMEDAQTRADKQHELDDRTIEVLRNQLEELKGNLEWSERQALEEREKERLERERAEQRLAEEARAKEAAEAKARSEAERLRLAEAAREEAEQRAFEETERMAREHAEREERLLKERESAYERERREAEEAERRRAEEDAWRLAEANRQLKGEGEEYDRLRPFREDICFWINSVLETDLVEDSLLREIADGVLLCQMAEAIDKAEEESRRVSLASSAASSVASLAEEEEEATPMRKGAARKKDPETPVRKVASGKARTPPSAKVDHGQTSKKSPEAPKVKKRLSVRHYQTPSSSIAAAAMAERPLVGIEYHPEATRGGVAAEQNLRAFLEWTHGLGLTDPDVFEVADVMQYKNARRVLFGLYDVARRTRGLPLPRFVWLERLAEMPPRKAMAGDSVDEAVNEVLMECVCQPRLSLRRVAAGKYVMVGSDSRKPLLVKATGRSVVVRVGGGWTPLRVFLLSSDPCRGDENMLHAREAFLANQRRLQSDMKVGRGGVGGWGGGVLRGDDGERLADLPSLSTPQVAKRDLSMHVGLFTTRPDAKLPKAGPRKPSVSSKTRAAPAKTKPARVPISRR